MSVRNTDILYTFIADTNKIFLRLCSVQLLMLSLDVVFCVQIHTWVRES